MDPLSAIGLVSSVITFIDFGYEVISAAREVYASATGTTTANDHIEFLNSRMEAVATDLTASKSRSGGMPADRRRLVELADKCLGLSDELKKLLDKLKANDPKSKRQILSSVLQNMRKTDRKRDLEARLDQCRQQLHLQLSHTTGLEILSRLSEIAQTGKCNERELASLNRQVATLKSAVAGMKSHSRLQDEARMVLDLSDQAVSKVLQNNILEALRFEEMEKRFDSIEEAHTKTFKWLLEDAASSLMIRSTTNTDDPWFENIMPYLEREEPLRRDIREGFTEWLSTGKGFFHISGKPGAGKSTLMKYLTESDKVKKCLNDWAGKKELIIASFFFWRHGSDYQKSLRGLLRSLLYSVLDQHSDLARVAFPDQWEAASNNPGRIIHFRQSDIQKAFIGLMKTPQVYLKHKFAFFIDGLDEFEGHDETLIKSLFEWVQSSPENVKICVSSRELPIFEQRFLNCPSFRLQEVTHHDIFLFVYDTLRDNEDVKIISKPQDVAKLGHMLVQRAEGVFLWVSLALRLVERGLVLEDSIEELKSSIDVLPTEVEQLFRVIFDSIKREPDLVKRRKAMRTLSLAVDELEAAPFFGPLWLTHLSFMDDYDRNSEFASHVRGFSNTTDIITRLSRCRKQVTGGCRGFLSINTRAVSNSNDLFRQETVELAHRSLVEFFQLSEVRECVEAHSKGFDKLHFYCQTLIAELKLWPPNIVVPVSQKDKSETSLINASSQRHAYFSGNTESELTDRRPWFERDLRRLTIFYYFIQAPDTSTLFSALNQLRELADGEGNPISQARPSYICEWRIGEISVWTLPPHSNPLRCHSTALFTLTALESGLYEFWQVEALDNNLQQATLQSIQSRIMGDWLNRPVGTDKFPRPHFDRLLRSLATCLADGTSANSLMLIREFEVPVSFWQNLVWSSIVTSGPKASPAPVWLLFLLHGAEQIFTLSFEQSCNFSQVDKRGKLISMTGQWGLDKHEVHSPIYVHEDHGGILELAKAQKWSVSLRELTTFWFPMYAEKFRRIHDLYDHSVGLPVDGMMDLRREFGLDSASWRTQVWEIPRPLIQSWEGISSILRTF